VPIAQLATAAGLQVLLGVYEFEPRDGCHDNSDCIAWTKSQVDQAITSANAPGSTVIGIVVGNEDYPYPAKAGCPTVAGGRWTRAAPAGMAPAVSWW